MSEKPKPQHVEVKLEDLADWLRKNGLVVVPDPERRGQWPPVVEVRECPKQK